MNPCNDCPFKKPFKENGALDWITDVFNLDRIGGFFQHSCHKTDPRADGFVGGKKRECVGAATIHMNAIDGTPGKGGVYDSFKDACKAHLEVYLKENK